MPSSPMAIAIKPGHSKAHDCNHKTIGKETQTDAYKLRSILPKTLVVGTICFWCLLTTCRNDTCSAADLRSNFYDSPALNSPGVSSQVQTEYQPRRHAERHYIDSNTNHADRVWGEIVDSPLGARSLYKENDLVYVRCPNSKLGLIREGDRFGILPYSASHCGHRHGKPTALAQKSLKGQIEITNVGSDLITGIILECKGLIQNGYKISPLVKTSGHLTGAEKN